MNMSDKRETLRTRATFLLGVAEGIELSAKPSMLTGEIKQAAYDLEKASDQMCSQGFYGCRGGECTSDHK